MFDWGVPAQVLESDAGRAEALGPVPRVAQRLLASAQRLGGEGAGAPSAGRNGEFCPTPGSTPHFLVLGQILILTRL